MVTITRTFPAGDSRGRPSGSGAGRLGQYGAGRTPPAMAARGMIMTDHAFDYTDELVGRRWTQELIDRCDAAIIPRNEGERQIAMRQGMRDVVLVEVYEREDRVVVHEEGIDAE